ncbi:MAG TPA: MauE/DoxX family redox-associated membrane protein [Spirochaetota bacterium]|nr:MauE/DoxX family redox-associated membrane protein [Spirochaetota bacterium]HPJ37751.1 MauE/DoxX family redox-associated membrane protein [Spirochaetota bacterium]HPQ52854.1 MauE/DoxX family redox-associated membrane protein [Spirochaetota bacterium]
MQSVKNIWAGIIYGSRIVSVIRIVLGMLFLYSGIVKTFDPAAFGNIIDLYGIVPAVVVPYIAIVLPYVELLTGLFLITGFRIKAVSCIAMIMMAIFTAAIAVNVVRGRSFDCGCFELGRFGISEDISIFLVVRDCVLFLVFLLLFNVKRNYYSLDNVLEKDGLYNLS